MQKRLDRTLALAGVFQASCLVKQIAWTGTPAQDSFSACISSLFKIDAKSTTDIYGNINNLNLGLKEIIDLFTNSKIPKDQEIARYVLSLLHLERKLIKKKSMLDLIRQGIDRAQSQAEHFSMLHDNVLANLAGIYTDTLSTFSYRIHVAGEANFINNVHKANKIRALLLSGIRSAVLWRQLGGNRWQLLFCRKQLIYDAQQLREANDETNRTKCNSSD
jgi:high frequency lysogenization protein